MSDLLKYLGITADAFGILLSIIALLILFVSTTMEKKTKGYFICI